ncbi:hypothetical protein [Streptomyces aureocirculatus]|uniref:hypothetical protein n=1 Tax=Streptomyces aureocirculatus TaxID=67275 RepID=UPI0004CB6649|nr:hypothetical protein [Streptomyces aureocirculatus]
MPQSRLSAATRPASGATALRAELPLVPGAVEELLRFLSVADGLQRVAIADIEVARRIRPKVPSLVHRRNRACSVVHGRVQGW